MEYLIGCVLIITVIAIYFPILHIRKTNKVEKLLERIETNTRKA